MWRLVCSLGGSGGRAALALLSKQPLGLPWAVGTWAHAPRDTELFDVTEASLCLPNHQGQQGKGCSMSARKCGKVSTGPRPGPSDSKPRCLRVLPTRGPHAFIAYSLESSFLIWKMRG